MIESYRFGNINIRDKQYRADIVISKDEIIENWWRKKGHELCVADVESYIDQFRPSKLVVGTGKFGLMKVLAETRTYLHEKDIELITATTGKAVNIFNKMIEKDESVIAAFHLTC